MDTMKIGGYIQHLRKAAGMTQKELAERLGVSFQAVSKWERGDALPDTGLLPDLCDELNTTADKLLNGGSILLKNRKLMRVEDVIAGFEHIEAIGKCFGENCDFYTGMVEGINAKMDLDLLGYMDDRKTLEVLWAEVLIQGILAGRTVDMDEVRAEFTNEKMIAQIEKYMKKAAPGSAE
ncbi:MAG: helix-turn-helix transcriptional regulator [Clostridia bacterium]|nr:helix-turn-helix transcriptional regulator [Clostridia bacterium]